MECFVHMLHYRAGRLDSSLAIENGEPRLLNIRTSRIAQDNVFAVTEKQRSANQGFYILDVFGQHGLTNAQSARRPSKVQLLSESNYRLHQFRFSFFNMSHPMNSAEMGIGRELAVGSFNVSARRRVPPSGLFLRWPGCGKGGPMCAYQRH